MQKYHDEPKQYKGYLKSALVLAKSPIEEGILVAELSHFLAVRRVENKQAIGLIRNRSPGGPTASLSYDQYYLVTRMVTRVPRDREGRFRPSSSIVRSENKPTTPCTRNGVPVSVPIVYPRLEEACTRFTDSGAVEPAVRRGSCSQKPNCYVHLRMLLEYLPRKADDDCRQELRWLYGTSKRPSRTSTRGSPAGRRAPQAHRLASARPFCLPRQHHKHGAPQRGDQAAQTPSGWSEPLTETHALRIIAT